MDEPALSFTAFVLSLASTAAIHFGDLPDPVSGQRSEPNLEGAAQMIEILALLDQKKRGNLTDDVRRVDAILFTHSHADHVMGLDEVRRYNALQKGPIPCYADGETIVELKRTFAYVFDASAPSGGIPQLSLFRLGGMFALGGIDI